MAKVFISYRRADSAAISGRIYDRMVARFKRKNVFKDVDDIPAGVNFGTYIQESLRDGVVMLLVIGRAWLDMPAPDDSRRLDDPTDWVRIEIETALSLGLTIIPLLVEGAMMPPESSLPESLREIALLNALPVRNDPDFARDMERVIASVEHAVASRPAPSIFRRGATSRPTPAQPEPTPSPASVVTPVTVAPPVISSANISETVIVPPKQAPSSSSVRARRAVMAALAAVVVVVSLGVLFYAKGNPFSTAGANNHPTQTTSAHVIATTRATQTSVTKFPLSVPLPGPNPCAQGWTAAYWVLDSGNPDCSNGHTTRLIAGACGYCPYVGEFSFDITGSGIPLPSSYTISVEVSHLTANTEVAFFLSGGRVEGRYRFSVSGNRYTVGGDLCPGASTCSGLFDTSTSHILAFHFDGSNVTAEIDKKPVARQPETVPPESVNFAIQITTPISMGYTGNPHRVDFTNFLIGE